MFDDLDCFCGARMRRAAPLPNDPDRVPLLRCPECGHYEPDETTGTDDTQEN